ncbi:MAG: hypothetical protein ACNA8W_16515 [Bradymonadaceae bacterium]
MTKEIVTGILVGLLAILIVVGIGSAIGFALSHEDAGPAPDPPAVAPASPSGVTE